jgi:hypothetical protein
MERWIDVPAPRDFLSLTMPPLLSLACPGATPAVRYDYSTSQAQLRGHLFIDHLEYFTTQLTLDKLIYEHSIHHEHPYWAHHPSPGVIIHIHANPLPGEELTEWTW